MKLSEKEIRRFLALEGRAEFELFDTIPSTNTYLKSRAASGAPEGLIVLADSQSGGRGRMGRSFSSPNGSGIYMSILLRPTSSASDAIAITACAAVAVSEAIEAVTGIKVGIKWVNDLYLNGKKVCGILAESSISKEAAFEYVVLGIGVNLTDSFADTELASIAGGLFPSLSEKKLYELKHRLTAAIIDRFFYYYLNGLDRDILLSKYRSRLFIIGRKVDVISYSGENEATVLGLNDDFTLKVQYENGETSALFSGEVRLKIK